MKRIITTLLTLFTITAIFAQGDFRFAVIPDRTGGHRPGIYEDAIRKLMLMQPEFVMSVGDLIEGYTEDSAEVITQWEEYDSLIAPLNMPFYYVPGNHDYSNELMAGIWKERYGPNYYHFMHKDVLFLCMSSEGEEAQMHGINEKQVQYFTDVLENHQEARWTLVFMHQPVWTYGDPGWAELEELLEDREYTVFAGHTHLYTKYVRNNSRYLVLATAGGISELRGPGYGEFDHLTWVTMTDSGPVVANLMLDGIYDENIFIEEQLQPLGLDPLLVKPLFNEGDFREETLPLEIFNNSAYPLSATFGMGQSALLEAVAEETEIEVPAGASVTIPLILRSTESPEANFESAALPLQLSYRYSMNNGREVTMQQQTGLAPVKKLYLREAPRKMKVDGNLREWEELPYSVEAPAEGIASFDFSLSSDADYLYLGVDVRDDDFYEDPYVTIWEKDALLINFDPTPVEVSANNRKNNIPYHEQPRVYLLPSFEKGKVPQVDQQERLPNGTLFATAGTDEGFSLEVALPMEYIESVGGKDWETVRFNIGYSDIDGEGSRTIIRWRPNWSDAESYIGSGTFFKTAIR
ncbi:MAG: metallophosphoesterase [Bacteroidota bacterium]